jgi:tetratricopeptide (TPR) repeat protein
MERGEHEFAAELQTQALGLYSQLDDAAAMAYAHNALGETWRTAGDLAKSRQHYRASLELARKAGHERSIAVAQSNLASVEIALGDAASARERLVASLPIFVSLDDRVNIASCLATLACVDTHAGSRDGMNRAAQLFGLATRLIQEAHGKFETADASEFNRCMAECRAVMGQDAFARAWAEGSSRELEEAISYFYA